MSNTSCFNVDETQVPAKKLKQARLVFKPLPSPAAKKGNTSNTPKRKFIEIDSDVEIIEVKNKDESKENHKTVDNGPVDQKEATLKRKKISASDEELNESKELKTEVKDKLNVISEKKSCVVKEVSSKDKEELSPSKDSDSKANEKQNGAEHTELKDEDHVEKDVGSVSEEKEAPAEVAEASVEDETPVSKPEAKDKTNSGEVKDEETAEDNAGVVSIDEEEKSSESSNVPMVVDLQDESNEEDKKSKEGSISSGTSEDQVLNVSTSSSKEPSSVTLVKTPVSETKAGKPRKLTPKQLEKQKEREKIRLEKEKKKADELEAKLKLKREKQELKEKELEERERIKREKEELKRKEHEEKKKLEEQKRKEKEEKEKKRIAELELKNEEKQRKEEEKKKAEEERRKQEELEQQKKNKAKAQFARFFVKPKVEHPTKMETEAESKPTSLAFMPFQEKPFMKLAPRTRVTLSAEQIASLENALSEAPESSDVNTKQLYLDQLKSSGYQKRTSGKTWPNEIEDDLCIVESDDEAGTERNIVTKRTVMRAKLLQFHENHRPPYYGTWRKTSKTIKPRNPCQKDDVHFDYEVDSDDEWEEGEGESLRGSDDEKESEDDYEVDNETFVPHGYLSDEEVQEEEDGEDMNPEAQKLKLKLLGEEFEAEQSEKTERLKPILVGPMWINNNVQDTNCVDSRIVKYLMPRRAVWKEERGPISTAEPIGADETSPDNANNPSSAKGKKFSDEEIRNLIRLVHGSVRNRNLLAREFISRSSSGTLTATKAKIREIATYQVCPSNEVGMSRMAGRKCWFVTPEIRAQYGLSELLASDNPHCASIADPSPVATPEPAANITKFTKVLSEEERLKQLSDILTEHNKHQSPQSAIAASPIPAGASLITKYTKVLSEEECLKQLASPLPDKLPKPCDKGSKSPSIGSFLRRPKSGSPSATLSSPVSSKTSESAPKEKKRLPLLASVKVGEEIPDSVRPSCASTAKPSQTHKLPEKSALPEPMDVDLVKASPVTGNSVTPSPITGNSVAPTPSTPLVLIGNSVTPSAHAAPIGNSVNPSPSASTVPSGNSASVCSSAKVKKRVPLLVSVKRGEQIPLSARPSAAQSSFSSEKAPVAEEISAEKLGNQDCVKPSGSSKSGVECID